MFLTITYIGSNSCYSYKRDLKMSIDRLNTLETDHECFSPAPIDADHDSYVLRVV